MKIISLIFMLIITMASASLLAMEDTEEARVPKAFLHTISNSTLAPRDLYHHLQSKDFTSGPYTFHCWHQSIYLKNLNSDPNYPRYEPIGMPHLETVSTMSPTQHIALKWLMKDNPSQGLNTFSSIIFSYEENEYYSSLNTEVNSLPNNNFPIKDQAVPVVPEETVPVIPAEQVLQLKVGAFSLNPEQTKRVENYIAKAGYDGTNFDFRKFSQWYSKKFMGYEGENIGFTSSHTPIVFNKLYNETYEYYLDVLKGFYVRLHATRHFFRR